ncbi:hypothetical protein ABT246_25790 [Streptomyces sp. NPDC001553]|uniref:hypothetical protein n=1 Tax=Streptomyces sp. NPDC001553 TaxID=3154385 RepID=UPI003320E4BE
MQSTFWRGPDGRHWDEGDATFDPATQTWSYRLIPAAQDPTTGRWSAKPTGRPITVIGHPGQIGYIQVSSDPLGEPRIARLHAGLVELLADYEKFVGQPHPHAGELHILFEDVAALPEELRRRGRAAAQTAAQSGFQRGLRNGRRR